MVVVKHNCAQGVKESTQDVPQYYLLGAALYEFLLQTVSLVYLFPATASLSSPSLSFLQVIFPWLASTWDRKKRRSQLISKQYFCHHLGVEDTVKSFYLLQFCSDKIRPKTNEKKHFRQAAHTVLKPWKAAGLQDLKFWNVAHPPCQAPIGLAKWNTA